MPAKHSLKTRRAERRRAVEVVDAHTFTAHFLTTDALAAGRHPKGRYIALCGREVLPAGLTEPGHGRCSSCVAIPAQRTGV
jgi:hypothetical protein